VYSGQWNTIYGNVILTKEALVAVLSTHSKLQTLAHLTERQPDRRHKGEEAHTLAVHEQHTKSKTQHEPKAVLVHSDMTRYVWGRTR